MYKRRKWSSYTQFRNSEQWRALRALAIREAGHRCTRCHCTHSSKNPLQVHHKNYDRPWGQEKLRDLAVLCDVCHSIAHGLQAANDPQYSLDFDTA